MAEIYDFPGAASADAVDAALLAQNLRKPVSEFTPEDGQKLLALAGFAMEFTLGAEQAAARGIRFFTMMLAQAQAKAAPKKPGRITTRDAAERLTAKAT